MRQSLLFLALHLLGVAVCLAVGPRRRTLLCCALGFPIGLATLIPLLMLLAAAGVPHVAVTAAAVAGVVAAAALLGIRAQGWPTWPEWRTILLWTAGFGVIAAAVSVASFSVMTPDSHFIVALGRVITDDQGFSQGTINHLGNRGAFLIVTHSLGVFIGRDHLYAVAPVLGLSMAALFAVSLWQGMGALGLDRARRLLPVALVAGALFTVYLVELHVLYIHESMGAAVFLTVFVVAFWLGEVEKDARYVPVAFIAATGFALYRIENPLAVVIFLALVVLPARQARRPIAIWFAALVLVAAAWNLWLGVSLEGSGRSLDRSRCFVMTALLAGLFLYWLASAWTPLARLHRHVPAAAAVGGLLALIAAFATKPEVMTDNARILLANLIAFDDWGLAWVGVGLLAVLGLLTPHPPGRAGMVVGIPLYLAFILLLAYGRGYYRVDTYDSGTRMALHVLPLAFYYLGLKLALLLQPAPASGATAPDPARPTAAG